MQTPEQIAEQVFDQWYADAASFTGPTARRECIAAIAAALRVYADDARREEQERLLELLKMLLWAIEHDLAWAPSQPYLERVQRAIDAATSAIRALTVPATPPE